MVDDIQVGGYHTWSTFSKSACSLACSKGEVKVNKQDFLQVLNGSGIEKMEDNLTSADQLSYTTNANGSQLDLVNLVSISRLAITHSTAIMDRGTGKQFINNLIILALVSPPSNPVAVSRDLVISVSLKSRSSWNPQKASYQAK